MRKITEKNIFNLYNSVCAKYLAQDCTDLSVLSDYELIVYITGKTIKFGRGFYPSLENAEYHLKNRDDAIKIFNTPKSLECL